MNTEKLICEILKRPPIWMSRHPQFKYKNVVKRMWEEIKECFPDCEVEQLKKKWKNLKDTFRKELKKIPTSRSGDLTTQSQWKYFDLLTFLKDELMTSDEEAHIKDNEDKDVSSREAHSTERTVSPIPTLHSSKSLSEMSHPRKRKADDIRSEYLEIERRKLKILEEEVARQNNKHICEVEKTGDYYFLMSLLPEMQKLSSIKRIRLRNKINQALIEEISGVSDVPVTVLDDDYV